MVNQVFGNEIMRRAMMIKFLFFAHLVDEVGVQSMDLELVDGWVVGQYLDKISSGNSFLQAALVEDESVLVSVNQVLSDRNAILSNGDEVGLLPPFSGG